MTFIVILISICYNLQIEITRNDICISVCLAVTQICNWICKQYNITVREKIERTIANTNTDTRYKLEYNNKTYVKNDH